MRHRRRLERAGRADAHIVDQYVDRPRRLQRDGDALGRGHVERQKADPVGGGQQAIAWIAHGGDDDPALDMQTRSNPIYSHWPLPSLDD